MGTPFELIIKYLEEHATSEEIELLSNWVQESPKNEQIFNELSRSWHRPHRFKKLVVIPSKKKVWRSIQNDIATNATSFEWTFSKRHFIQWVAMAAGIALFMGFFITFLVVYHPKMPESVVTIETPPGQKVHMTLPDGTKVWLNSGSTLSYHSDFNQHKERIVSLAGEGFFEVVHHADKPFIVKTKTLNVKVLGTVFDVLSYQNEAFAQVSLVRGKVCVYSDIDHKPIALLTPNQMVILNTLNGTSRVSSCNAINQSLWIRNELRFEGVTPQEMFNQLGRWYGVNFNVSNLPTNRRFWLTLKTESLTETIQLINKISPLDYTINGEEVHVKFRP